MKKSHSHPPLCLCLVVIRPWQYDPAVWPSQSSLGKKLQAPMRAPCMKWQHFHLQAAFFARASTAEAIHKYFSDLSRWSKIRILQCLFHWRLSAVVLHNWMDKAPAISGTKDIASPAKYDGVCHLSRKISLLWCVERWCGEECGLKCRGGERGGLYWGPGTGPSFRCGTRLFWGTGAVLRTRPPLSHIAMNPTYFASPAKVQKCVLRLLILNSG